MVIEQQPTVEALDSYVVVEKQDVLEAIGTFVAAYLVTLPEAQNMKPAELQAAVKRAFKVSICIHMRSSSLLGRSLYLEPITMIWPVLVSLLVVRCNVPWTLQSNASMAQDWHVSWEDQVCQSICNGTKRLIGTTKYYRHYIMGSKSFSSVSSRVYKLCAMCTKQV